jgi:endoglucanase
MKPIRDASRRHMIAILDLHNYDRYYGQLVDQGSATQADFADLWSRLATVFKGNPRVWFGLSNEPNSEPTELWVGHANAAIAAIRKAGAHNFILVCGNGWSGAYHWFESWYGTPNATALLAIVDPDDNYAFECHIYFDPDNEGKTADVASPTIGVERAKIFGDWCRDNHKRGFLGEFGMGGTPESGVAANNLLAYLEQNPDVWVGWTCWAGGSLWGDNVLSLEPSAGKDKPQIAFLAPHLHGAGRVPANPPIVPTPATATATTQPSP